jgi:hypothetical protein
MKKWALTFCFWIGKSSQPQGCQMVCFHTKNSNLGKFSWALNWKNGYILWPFGICYGHLGYFMTIRYSLCSFGTFFPVSVSWTNKNLATLLHHRVAFSFKISSHSHVLSNCIVQVMQLCITTICRYCQTTTPAYNNRLQLLPLWHRYV